MTYQTKDGDMLDAICHSYYGASSGYMERVLAANPGIAAQGPVYQAGVLIELPDVKASAVQSARIALWS